MKEENLSNDLEKLVTMAEKISETVNDLRTKITNLRAMFFVSIIALYASGGFVAILISKPYWFDGIPVSIIAVSIFVGAALFLGVAYFIFQYFRKIKKYRKDLKEEIEILHRLLVMIDEYRSHCKDDGVGFVDEAIIEMRLQRIKYSGEW